jgi:hypothetical protein
MQLVALCPFVWKGVTVQPGALIEPAGPGDDALVAEWTGLGFIADRDAIPPAPPEGGDGSETPPPEGSEAPVMTSSDSPTTHPQHVGRRTRHGE